MAFLLPDDHLNLVFQLVDIDNKIRFEGDLDQLRRWLVPGITSDQFRRHIAGQLQIHFSWENRPDVAVLCLRENGSEEVLCRFSLELTRRFLLQLLFLNA